MEDQLTSHVVNDGILAGYTISTPRQERKSSGLESKVLFATCCQDDQKPCRTCCLSLTATARDEKRSLGYFRITESPFFVFLVLPILVQLTFGDKGTDPQSLRQKVPWHLFVFIARITPPSDVSMSKERVVAKRVLPASAHCASLPDKSVELFLIHCC